MPFYPRKWLFWWTTLILRIWLVQIFAPLIQGKDVHEMMAELANPAFRAALKAKKLWRQVINGIKRILGIQIPGIESEQTDALNVLENALEVLLDNLDVNTFNRYKGAGLFAKMEFNKNLDFNDNESNTLDKINERFNQEIDELSEKNANSKIFNLGMPNDVLKSCGIQSKPIRLYGAKIMSKAKKHGYKPSDLKDLPNALQAPIAIFKGSQNDSFAILTELKIGDNNVLVSLSIGKGGHDVDFNIISSAYGKNNESIIKWINKERMLFVDKKKALDYISVPAPIAGAQYKQELDSATKVIESFVNPTANTQNSSKLYRQSSTPLEARQHSEEVMREKIDDMANVFGVTPEYIYDEKNTKQKGWYEPATGKVVVNLAAHATIEDARQTYLHEVVGHFGLRGLLKDKFEQVRL